MAAIHGLALKLLALGAKAGFLFLIVPGLPDGTFSEFVFLSSSGLLLGRALACGACDQIPIEFGRSEVGTESFVALALRGFIPGALAGIAYGFVGSWPLGILGFGLLNASGSIVSGLLRASWVEGYERLLNLPWILFLAALLLSPSGETSGVFSRYLLAHGTAIAVMGTVSGLFTSASIRRVDWAIVRKVARQGLPKMGLEASWVSGVRGVILLPKVLLGTLASDAVSFAASLGEALSQLPMVVVNRNFAKYCAGKGSGRGAARSALALFLVLLAGAALTEAVFAPSGLIGRFDVSLPRIFDAHLAAQALVLYAAVVAFYEVRFFAWSQGRGLMSAVVAQSVFLVLQVPVLYLLPMELWLGGAALACLIGVATLVWLERSIFFGGAKVGRDPG